MSEQVLDHANVDTLFEQMGRKTMSQCVDGDRLAEPGRRGCAPTRELQCAAAAESCGRKTVTRPSSPKSNWPSDPGTRGGGDRPANARSQACREIGDGTY